MTKEFLDATTVAKMIRKDLKEAFKGVKFSVKTDKYSGGSSIDIDYTDGPTVGEVDDLVDKYRGASFNAMEDMKEYNDIILDGVAYRGGPDFIFVNRSTSREFVKNVLNNYGIDLEEVAYHEGMNGVSIDGLYNRYERLLIADASAMTE